MDIVLCGYGRMGKQIASLISGDDKIVHLIDPFAPGASAPTLLPEHLEEADVAIEFSQAEAAQLNLELYIKCNTPAVVGTTGWDANRYKKIIQDANIAYLWASNFSIGAYILKMLAKNLAQAINNISDYDIMMHEYHHKLKKDSPSGTALSVAQAIIDALDRKTTISSEVLQDLIAPEALHVSASRGGNIPGTHTVLADSSADSISITHTARNRNGFALGALYAAQWICKKQAGFYSIEDFMYELLAIK